MTKGNKLTRPFAGAQYRSQAFVGGILTPFCRNFNDENNEWEVAKAMPEGTEDVVEFSSRVRADAEVALGNAIERDYPGLIAQHGGFR